MPPKKEAVKKESLISNSTPDGSETDIARLCDSAKNKLEEVVAEIIYFKNKLTLLFAKQNQITDVESFLNEICDLVHVAFPDAKRTVVLKLNHQEILYARKLVLLENIIDKALLDFNLKNESYQSLFRLKIRVLAVRADLMWFIYCKIKMIRFDENNVEMDFVGVPQDLEQDFINLWSYLNKKPEINFISTDQVALEYFFYSVLAFFRYNVLNKNEVKNCCLSFSNELFNFLCSLKNVAYCKKGIIFIVRTVLDRWSVDSKDFPVKEMLGLLTGLDNHLKNKNVTGKTDAEVNSFIDGVTNGYIALAEFKLVFKQKLDALKRKINCKKQVKSTVLV